MELQSISTVSRCFNISVRTLRYYEQIGLIGSEKKHDGAYRHHSEATVRRIQQIIILRKLRIPLKQIAEILEREDIAYALDVFTQNLREIEDEITALSTIRGIIQAFIEKLPVSDTALALLDDENLLEIADALTVSKISFKEDKTMNELNKASEKLTKLTDRDVRILYLPPMTVAAFHRLGSMAELEGATPIREFIEKNDLFGSFPEARHFGFNHPDGKLPDMSDHGYERWISIPPHMEVSSPFEKKRFSGGLYAAHMIPMGSFEEWEWLLA